MLRKSIITRFLRKWYLFFDKFPGDLLDSFSVEKYNNNVRISCIGENIFMKKPMGRGFFVFIIILAIAVDWMACDIFLPAQPEILKSLHTDAQTLNGALSVYFVVSAISVLFGGPLSDKYGRKTLMVAAMVCFTGFAFGAALAPNVGFLIFCRGGSALGAGVITAVGMAMVKDYLNEDDFQQAMAIIQSVIVLGPVVSPFLGSFVLVLGGWRWVLATLGILGLIATIFTFLLPETLEKSRRVSGGVLPALLGLVNVAKDRNFSLLLIVISMFGVPFFAFVAVCSYICIDYFGLSYLQYSLFYGGICMLSFTAPFVYLWMDKRMKGKTDLWACFAMFIVTVIGLFAVGKVSILLLFIVFIPYTYAEGISRPLGMVLLLNQHDDTSGAVSALTGFSTSVIGSLGSVVATLSWSNYVTGLAWILSGCCLIALVCWLLLLFLKVKI